MTQVETDDDRGILERFREWSRRPGNVTNGRLLTSRLTWTVFLALSAWVGVRQIQLDNQVTRDRVDEALEREIDACADMNERRSEAKQVALGDVSGDQEALDSDVATWQSLDDLIDGGIPEPSRSTVFAGLASRQVAIQTQRELIDSVYQEESCEDIPHEEE